MIPHETSPNFWSLLASQPKWKDNQDCLSVAKNKFLDLQVPSRKEELWRQTNLKFLKELSFQLPSLDYLMPEQILSHISLFQKKDFHFIVYVNGKLNDHLSKYASSIIVDTDRSAKSEAGSSLEYFKNLNEIYSPQNSVIKITKNLDKPLCVLSISTIEGGGSVIVNPSAQIIIEKDVKASLWLHNWNPVLGRNFINSVWSIELKKQAVLSILNSTNLDLNSIHFDHVTIKQFENSVLNYVEMNLRSEQIRKEFVLDLMEQNCRSTVMGINTLQNDQIFGSYTQIRHHASHCTSEQKYKSLLKDKSQAIFSGQVYIGPNIQKADSRQINQNLLLSNEAEVNSRPILNIYSDDVKASHGSTVGQLDEDEIFYLASRCISRSKAEQMIASGFLKEVIGNLPVELSQPALVLLDQAMSSANEKAKVLQ